MIEIWGRRVKWSCFFLALSVCLFLSLPVVTGIMSRRKLILSLSLGLHQSLSLRSPSFLPRPWINLLRQHFRARWTVQPNRFHGSAVHHPLTHTNPFWLLLLVSIRLWLPGLAMRFLLFEPETRLPPLMKQYDSLSFSLSLSPFHVYVYFPSRFTSTRMIRQCDTIVAMTKLFDRLYYYLIYFF